MSYKKGCAIPWEAHKKEDPGYKRKMCARACTVGSQGRDASRNTFRFRNG